MSRNLARRGGGSYNPNSNKAARQEKKNNKKQLSDNSGSDSDSTTQKRSRIITDNTMDEDFVADTPADDGLDGSTSTAIPQQNNSSSGWMWELAPQAPKPNLSYDHPLSTYLGHRTMPLNYDHRTMTAEL
ncbi:hypothetical protein GLOIN_2v1673942 [Rhizophagus irregularis DAOM 181602=DAOM 197198]|nr:hypothetical protein GLOIN_2v1673942 [Rhizophagus irregularis DAOM 181602=DAOM 197198]